MGFRRPPVCSPMTMTTRVLSVTMPVADQDRAPAFYTKIPGCELVTDVEIWLGGRLVEVAPRGSAVGLLLLPPDSEVPVTVGWAQLPRKRRSIGRARSTRPSTTTRCSDGR